MQPSSVMSSLLCSSLKLLENGLLGRIVEPLRRSSRLKKWEKLSVKDMIPFFPNT